MAKVHALRRLSTRALRQRRQRLVAQLHGPHFSVILDLEPIRPGEE